jgi:hypothetical protein
LPYSALIEYGLGLRKESCKSTLKWVVEIKLTKNVSAINHTKRRLLEKTGSLYYVSGIIRLLEHFLFVWRLFDVYKDKV